MKIRRTDGAATQRLCIARVALFALACVAATPLPASPWQELAEIRAAAEAFIESRVTDAALDARAGALDARLRLQRCDGVLEAFRPPGGRTTGNTTVGVRCTGSQRWKLYVPVRVEARAQVLVARRPLARGTRLDAADLVQAEHDLTSLPYGYFRDLAALTGRELRRPVGAGTVILPSMVAEPQLVRRGQTVVLSARQSGVQISMQGRALADGALQQRIRVENLSSGRVIEGVVRSAERVEVLLD